MNKELQQNLEIRVFHEFAHCSGLPIISIENRSPPEPDILCEVMGEGHVAFELKEICSPNIAKTIDHLQKHPSQDPVYVYGDSSSDLRSFLENVRDTKKYISDHRIELLFYTWGRDGLPPDVIIPTIQKVFCTKHHKFSKIWFMGGVDEPCECVYPHSGPAKT